MSLQPLRTVLLADARAECDRIITAAEERARDVVATTEHDAQVLVDDARREGIAAASIAAAGDLADARRAARTAVLRARSTLYRELVAAADAELRQRNARSHAALVEQLSALARTQLGDDALIVRAPEGGIRASSRGRGVDYTLPTLLRRTLDRRGDRVEGLWS